MIGTGQCLNRGSREPKALPRLSRALPLPQTPALFYLRKRCVARLWLKLPDQVPVRWCIPRLSHPQLAPPLPAHGQL